MISFKRPRFYSAHETERMKELDGVELASFTSRAVALTIDFMIAGGLVLAAVFPVFALLKHIPSVAQSKKNYHFEMNFFEPNWYTLLYMLVFFGLSFYIGNGKTIGKWLMGIRVVSLVHHRLSLWHSMERAVGYGASGLELGFGFFQYFIHPNRRCVHDRIAETIVVRERKR